jgi:epoxyqueuosine reductase
MMHSQRDASELARSLQRHAERKGLAFVGCTSAAPLPSGQDGSAFDPRGVLPSARSVVVAACYVYGLDAPEPSEPGRPRGRYGPWTRAIGPGSRYGEQVVTSFLTSRGHQVVAALELPLKAAAVRSGAAYYGKNSLIHADGCGSYLKLSAVITDAELDCRDASIEASDCGDCDACVRACPTGAIDRPYHVVRERCICHWLKGAPIPREQRARVGAYIFRCGLCQEVCPKNEGLRPATADLFELEDKSDSPELLPLILADEEYYRMVLPAFVAEHGTETIRRNAIVALGNSGDPAALGTLVEALSWPEPSVRGVAAWALGALGGPVAEQELRKRLGEEGDASVRDEIEAALATSDMRQQ